MLWPLGAELEMPEMHKPYENDDMLILLVQAETDRQTARQTEKQRYRETCRQRNIQTT
jgi:hypothetical protein